MADRLQIELTPALGGQFEPAGHWLLLPYQVTFSQ